MSGVAITHYKLTHYGALQAIVPAASIFSGQIPEGTSTPAIGITQVSSTPRNIVAMPGTNVMHMDRVQVTVVVSGIGTSASGTGYAGLRTILKQVLAACPNTHGTVSGFKCDSILPDMEGPDFYTEDPKLLSGSRDFLVKWIAP